MHLAFCIYEIKQTKLNKTEKKRKLRVTCDLVLNHIIIYYKMHKCKLRHPRRTVAQCRPLAGTEIQNAASAIVVNFNVR